MIKLEQLKQLLAFSKHKTISKAAEKSHISQSALTRSIQQMEKNLNIKLFDRKKNKISLNENGKIIVNYSEKILNLLKKMERELYENTKQKNELTVGACTPSPLWSIVSLFLKVYPEKYVTTKIQKNSELLTELKNDNYQLIILSEPFNEDGFYCKKFETEELFLSVPTNHELADKKEIYFSDIKDDKMLLFNPIGIWEDVVLDKLPNINFLIQNDRVIFKELGKKQNILSFNSNLVVEHEGQTFKKNILVPILDEEAKITYYCVCKNNMKNEINKLFNEF